MPIFILGCVIVACSPDSLISIPTATPPPNVNPRDIVITDKERTEFAQAMAKQHDGLFVLGLDASYDAQFPDLHESYHVDEGVSFLGQVYAFNGDDQAHQVVFICMLDHSQTPCIPNAPRSQEHLLEPTTEAFLPVELSPLEKGMHDFDVLAVRDPYMDISAVDLNSRAETLGPAAKSNIFVGGLTTVPEVTKVFPEAKPGLTDYSSMFFITETPQLLDASGRIPVLLSMIASPGEVVDLYIHFNGLDYPEGETIAATAFINYDQVPLYYEGQAYTPLFVQREKKTWQPSNVQIHAPIEPGVYELLFYVRLHAFEPIEINRIVPLVVFSDVSQRIRLEVEER